MPEIRPHRIAIIETYIKEVEIYAEDEIDAAQKAMDLCANDEIKLDYTNFAERETEYRGLSRVIDLELKEVYGLEDIQNHIGSLDSKIAAAAVESKAVDTNMDVRIKNAQDAFEH